MEKPIVCNLGALNPHQRVKHKKLRDQLRNLVCEVHTEPEGVVIFLPANSDCMILVSEFITLERLCCPFLNFILEVKSDKRFILLYLTGTEEAKTFLEAQLGI